jgi:peptidoglycan/xylan/chitin deacetylase (PgdA/CDA1 family)
MAHQRTKGAIFRVLRFTFLPVMMRQVVQARRVTILVYHNPSLKTMEKHLAALQRRYNLISLRDFVDAHSAAAVRRLPRRSLILTLDDGYADNSSLRPLFENMGARATIFVVAGIIGKSRRGLVRLSDESIMELSASVDFQSHTFSHPVLTHCQDVEAREEILGSKAELESRYGFSIYAIAYPNGEYAKREIILARNCGYACALTTESGFNSGRTDLFQLKRICIDDADGIDELLVKASGLWGLMRPVVEASRRAFAQATAAAVRAGAARRLSRSASAPG